ncbi:nitronate monooxygenase [Deinococcus sp.]|uniref:nitronate monooxygenase n=1 Tax=Deinococcus sp. TaxID=47478 RepID=UPI002869D55C|nr:nitronate monooxygenase [Deinococcus sp.]
MTVATKAPASTLPRIIQGGMGVAISGWELARAVSSIGELGVISATGIDNLLVRRLQDGDEGGHVRQALAAYPDQERAQKAVTDYYIEGGRAPGQGYKRVPLPSLRNHRVAWELAVMGGFVEVWLAKQGHSNPVGANLLTKLQMHTLPALYGCLLADVDVVIMGAGIPRDIPGVLDAFAQGKPASIRLDIKGDSAGDPVLLTFDPADYGFGGRLLTRPRFYPIVTSHVLASVLAKKATGTIEGFIIEAPTAGGHNAPPRGTVTYDDTGQPIYGERDLADLNEMRKLGLPFWLAGGSGSPEALRTALDEGAAGIQVGTLFAYCKESGFQDDLRTQVQQRAQSERLQVYTDPLASPTGFPFKVVTLPDTLSSEDLYLARPRICDIGYLREAYRDEVGKVGLRCPAEPVDAFLSKDGTLEATVGRKCLCNALMADAGHAQIQKGGYEELPLLTSGDGVSALTDWPIGYTAADVVAYLRTGLV